MNKHTRRHSRILFVLSILPPTAWVAYRQSTTSLRGTVSDSLGGVIPAAVVTLSDPGKGVSRQIVTDAVGEYAFLQVQPST